MAANVPAQTSPVDITLVGSNAHVQWIIPDNGSQPITHFTIEFLKADGNYITVPDGAYCSGTNPALNFCEVPMSVLTTAPYVLS